MPLGVGPAIRIFLCGVQSKYERRDDPDNNWKHHSNPNSEVLHRFSPRLAKAGTARTMMPPESH